MQYISPDHIIEERVFNCKDGIHCIWQLKFKNPNDNKFFWTNTKILLTDYINDISPNRRKYYWKSLSKEINRHFKLS